MAINLIFPTLVATLLVEGLVVFAIAPRAKVRRTKLVGISLFVNLATQPLFSTWFIERSQGQSEKWLYYFALGEAVVFAAESLFYYLALRRDKTSLATCATISALANGVSLAIGLALPL